MADIMDLLKGQLTEGLLDQLTQQIGAKDKQQTANAANGILETLVAALAKNTSNNDGASGLGAALDRDHDGSILDNLNDIISGQAQPTNSRSNNGAGILKHILGGKQSGIVDIISGMSGLNGNQTGNLMTTLAPIVLGMLGKQRREQNLDNSGLASILANAVSNSAGRQQQQQGKQLGMIGKLLDQDGDGKIIDDVAGMVGKFFRNRNK